MPSKSKKQAKPMAAAAHSPEFARKVGISQSAAKEWHAHDKAQGRFLKSLAEAMEKAKKPAKGPSKDPTLNWHEVPLDDDIQYSQGIIGRHSTDIRSVDDPYHYGRYEIDQTHPESRARNHPHKEYEVWHLGTGQSERGPMGGPYLLSGHDSLDEAKAAAHQHNLQRTLKRHVIRHYGLKPHEVKAVEAAWPGEGVKRFHGQHPDMVRHEVDRALGAIEKAKDPAQQEFARERSKEREEEQLRQREEREMEHMEHDEGIKKMFAGRGRYLADEQYHREQVKRNRRAATIKHHGFNDEQVNALEHAHGPEALERFHPDNDVHPDMVRNEVKRAVKHYREYAPHNEGAITAAGAEPDVSNIITHAPPVRANPNDPSTWWGRKRELQEAVKKPKLKKAVKDLRQDVIRAKRRAEPGSALNATLRYIGIEAKNRRSPRAEVVDKTPEMLAAERATIPGRPANVKTHFEQYPASWEPYLKAAYPDDEPIEKALRPTSGPKAISNHQDPSRHWHVRRAAASHPNATSAHLDRALGDQHPNVRRAAASHPHPKLNRALTPVAKEHGVEMHEVHRALKEAFPDRKPEHWEKAEPAMIQSEARRALGAMNKAIYWEPYLKKAAEPFKLEHSPRGNWDPTPGTELGFKRHYGRINDHYYEIDEDNPDGEKGFALHHMGSVQQEGADEEDHIGTYSTLKDAQHAALGHRVSKHYGLSDRERKAVEHAWPGQGMHRFMGAHPDTVKHEVARAVAAYPHPDEPIEKALRPTSGLEEISNHQDPSRPWRDRHAAASHPNATSAHLDRALGDADPSVREAAARHPNATSAHLDRALGDADYSVRRAAASHPNATSANLDRALGGADPSVRHAAASHPNATSAHLDRALGGADPSVRYAAARHPNATSAHLDRALGDQQPYVREAAASHPNATSAHLDRALEDQHPYVRYAAARHPNATSAHLDRALGDADYSVRHAAALHPNATSAHLDRALEDQQPYVRGAAASHPNATSAHLDRALGDQHPYVRHAAARHPNATSANLDRTLGDADPYVRRAAASHPNATSAHLDRALGDADPSVREAAARHPHPKLNRALTPVAKEHGVEMHEVHRALKEAFPDRKPEHWEKAEPAMIQSEARRALGAMNKAIYWEPYLKAAYPDDEPIEKVSYKPKKPLNYYEQHEKDVASGVAATKFKQKAQDVLRDVKANVSTGQKRPSGERSMRGSGKSPMRAEPGNSLFAVGPKRSSKLAGAKERRAYAYGTHWNAVVHHPAEKVVVANNHQYGGSTKLMVDTLRREIPKEFPGHTVILVHHPHAQRSSEITGGTLDEVHAHLKEAAAKHPEPEHRERAAQDLVKLSRILKK